jgi:hypothetical protein
MEEKRSIKIATIILLIMLVYALTYSLVGIISPDIFAVRVFYGYTGESWADFIVSSPKLADHHRATARLAGGFALSVIIAGFFIVLIPFRRGEKWAWYCILFSSFIGWVNSLIFSILAKDWVGIPMGIAGLVLLIVGIIIPAKAILGK